MFCHICVSLPEGSATLQVFKSADFSQSRAWKLPADMGFDWQLWTDSLSPCLGVFESKVPEHLGVSTHGGSPIAGWFRMEHPIKNGLIWGYPHGLETSIWRWIIIIVTHFVHVDPQFLTPHALCIGEILIWLMIESLFIMLKCQNIWMSMLVGVKSP